MIKILANDGIHADGQKLLEQAGFYVDTIKVPQDELVKKLGQYEAICVRSATKVRKEHIDAAPGLKVIARGGVGLDNIDVEYAKSKGIEVINTPAASSLSVAELAFGHMFNLSRSLHLSNREMPEKGNTDFKALKKKYSKGFELAGKTLGIIGLGRIGQEVARIGLGLKMKVLPVDHYVRETLIHLDLYTSDEIALSVKLTSVPLEEMLKQVDYLTIHIPFSGGEPIIGKDEIAKMKDGAFIVNTSRGGVVNEEALLEALESGKIAGAGLDVFEDEPSPNPALLNHPKISVSPHIGASTGEAQRNIGLALAHKIIAYLK
jgi:D-3-phosphoglycerate dehydrogenase